MEFLRKRSSNLPMLQRAYEECYQSSLRAILLEARNHHDDALRAWRTTKRIVSLQLSMITEAPKTEQETAIMSNILDIERQCYDRITFLERGGPDTNPYSSYPLYSADEESHYDSSHYLSAKTIVNSTSNLGNGTKNDNYYSQNSNHGYENSSSNKSYGNGSSEYINNNQNILSSHADVSSRTNFASSSFEPYASSQPKTPPPLPPKVSLNLSPTANSISFLDLDFSSQTSPFYHDSRSPPAPPLHRSEYQSFFDPKYQTTPSNSPATRPKPPIPQAKRPAVVRRKVSNPLDSDICIRDNTPPESPKLSSNKNESTNVYSPLYQSKVSTSLTLETANPSSSVIQAVPQSLSRTSEPSSFVEEPKPEIEKRYQPPPLIIPTPVKSSPQLSINSQAYETDIGTSGTTNRKISSMSSLSYEPHTSSMKSTGSVKNTSPPSSPVQNAPRTMLLTLRSGTKGKKIKEEKKHPTVTSVPVHLGSKKTEKTAIDPKSAVAAAKLMTYSSTKQASRPLKSSVENATASKPKTVIVTKSNGNLHAPKPKQPKSLTPVNSINRPSSTPVKSVGKPPTTTTSKSTSSTSVSTVAVPKRAATKPGAARSASPVKRSGPLVTSSTNQVLMQSASIIKPVRSASPVKQSVARTSSPVAKTPAKTAARSTVKYTVIKPSKPTKQGAVTSKSVKPEIKVKSKPASQVVKALKEDTPKPKEEETELDENDKWMKEARAKIENVRGIDPNAAEQIFNDVVVKGDPVVWDDIAGLEQAKASLKETVVYPFLRPDLFSGLREPAQGMLLFGPPGTGKTMLARAVATESQSTFFSISASSLTSKFLGESEKLVRALFLMARALAPSIIFVDEIDSLLSARSENGEHETSRRIKTEFLVQWSALQHAAAGKEHEDVTRVLVLAATNLPWVIDEAARRRFVRRQYIPLPEPETRKHHLQKLLNAQKHDISPEQFDELVKITDGYSGSDMTALAKDAAMGPLRSLGEALLTTPRDKIRPIGFEDFIASMKTIRPSVSKEGLKVFEDWAAMYGSSGA